jgi:hypothetical protein
MQEQMKAARKLAAKRAAGLPRGANMRIRPYHGEEDVTTAFDAADDDPLTAVKIAEVMGWTAVQRGMQTVQAGAATTTTARVAAPTKSIKDLKAGVDYEWIEVTDDMSPDEVRGARIANAKSKSAAIKALKQSGAPATTAEAPAPAAQAQAAVPAAATAAPAPAAGGEVGELVPGQDYEFIEVTDDMSSNEVRQARIANAKAKSAAAKAMKAAGGTPAPAAPEPVDEGAAPATPQPEAEAVAVPGDAVAAAVPPPPDYIEVTDDMEANEVRQARIQNAKMKSAYNKRLKEMGIDPSTVN